MNQGFVFRKDGFTGAEQELLVNETLFHNANGYFGVRGNFEERYPSDCPTVRGQYVNGFYNFSDMKQPEKHYGFPEQKQTMVNTFDTQTMVLTLEGEQVDLFQGTVLEFSRILDMKKGTTVRRFVWESPKGRQAEICITRMASFQLLPLFTIEYQITPLNFSGTAVMESVHSGDVSNYFNPKDSRVAGEKIIHLRVADLESTEEGFSLIRSETLRSGLDIASVVVHKVYAETGELGCPNGYVRERRIGDKDIVETLTIPVEERKAVTIVKYTVTCDSIRYENVKEAARKWMITSVDKPLNYWYQCQADYLEKFWEKAKIEITGDEELNLSLHYNLYQLLQSVGKDEYCNIGAKGLSGEGYEGHYFWDTEMYIVPFFSLTQPEVARNLLSYRHHILDRARANARVMGYPKGALYPWRTINGDECSGYYPSGSAQYHINGDIAYAVVQYYLITGDWNFIVSKGAEIVMETARMWYDLGNFYQGTFQLHDLTGPDEYSCVVNNNYYTNLTAQHNMAWAAQFYHMLKEQGQLAALEEKIGIEEAEVEGFEEAAEKMLLLYDEKLDINPQDDSFLSKKEWDFNQEKKTNGPIMQWNHLYRLYRYQVCKQADTVLAHMIFEDAQKLSTMKNSFDYYEKRTTHDSSLSRCIFGIVASKLGMKEKAYEYFDFSSKLDILDSQHNTKDGIHTANMGGTYMGIVYGFLGLRVKKRGFFFMPSIPEQWNSYQLRLQLKGSLIEVTVTKDSCRFQLLQGEQITIFVYGREYPAVSELTIALEEW
ncbi:MAG: glycosyl hydrolase family 65 protein [Lachnospiraceae bacterium]|nr:glycosyl hydrolase family 65 protein [Lachnospiraceae bacterium]